jgi:mRNA interferase HigB
MHVISRRKLVEAWTKHTDSQAQLRLWYTRASKAQWQSIVDVRQVYPTADFFAPDTIFNIKGNAYRLIVRIDYERQTIYIDKMLTHEEYSKNYRKKKKK